MRQYVHLERHLERCVAYFTCERYDQGFGIRIPDSRTHQFKNTKDNREQYVQRFMLRYISNNMKKQSVSLTQKRQSKKLFFILLNSCYNNNEKLPSSSSGSSHS